MSVLKLLNLYCTEATNSSTPPIVSNLTKRQRKDEQVKLVEVKKKNLARSIDENSKDGWEKGGKDGDLAPLLLGRFIDREGFECRERGWANGPKQHSSSSHCQSPFK